MASPVEFELLGVETMLQRIRALGKTMPSRVMSALFLEAEDVMATSKRRYVPVRRGPLRASGHVGKHTLEGGAIEVRMAFGGPSAPYALAAHEHPSRSSPPSWKGKSIEGIDWNIPGTGPKYLETPLKLAARGMDRRLARRLML